MSSSTPFDGPALRSARKALGLKQRELAEYLGIGHQHTISEWEIGTLTIERPETLALAMLGLRTLLAPKGTNVIIECGFAADAAIDPDWTVRNSGRHCDECDRPESHLEKTRNVTSYRYLCLDCASRGGVLTLRRAIRSEPRS